MCRGRVATFADLCVALGAAPCHVQRVRFWPLKSAYFLGTRWGPPLFEALVANSRLLCGTLMYVARFEQSDDMQIWLAGGSARLSLRELYFSLLPTGSISFDQLLIASSLCLIYFGVELVCFRHFLARV